jgi:hypothetical protein
MTDEEIYAIKAHVGAELRGLTPAEERAYLKAQTAPICEQYGIRHANLAAKKEEPVSA